MAGPEAKSQTSSDYARGLCRAFGGAVIFGVPLMMTQEMWSLGFTIGRESVGKIALQSVPASIGAMLGSKQLRGGEDTGAEETEKRDASYGGELPLMLVGALFLAFNIALTEEVQLIAFQMTPFHALALGLVSLGLMHAFVYAIGFKGQESVAEGSTVTAAVLTYTIPGYAVALAMSFFVLRTFGRTDDVGLAQIATMTVVLGFPAAIGAATARLVI